jgi:hypothetical protein
MEMKHFKDAQGKLYGFAADGSQDYLKPEGLVEITQAEAQQQGILNYQAQQQQQAQNISSDYVSQRIMAYPAIGEFLDAWVKNDQTALDEYRQKCLAVKSQYPKPPGF